ncbi:hypothetical protein KC19_12G000600 [Ceratodon purpureus]|uniref:Uncharacterized protein n=1 Tax=Ceratodon purpureus TaxID=3225 RepID=A0A8T0G200_CERPU|nr:hypothetical protein KC19_12G000600 [Ceratodon purpureus]
MAAIRRAVVAFSEQFMDSVTWPNGMLVPSYPAGRYCDGWLLTDYIAFGVGARPNSPILDSIGADFT